MSKFNTNAISVIGTVDAEPVLGHKTRTAKIWEFPIRTQRLSGYEDVLSVALPQKLLDTAPLKKGDRIRIEGEVRTYNVHDENTGKSHVLVKVYARDIEPAGDRSDEDLVTVSGMVLRKRELRTTPLGRKVIDFIVSVKREHKMSYIPAIAWEATAKYVDGLPLSTMIDIDGRLQSREYTKVLPDGTRETHTAYELSVWNLEKHDPAEDVDAEDVDYPF